MTTTTETPNLRADAYRSNDVRATIIIPLAQNLIAGVAIGLLGCMGVYVFGALTWETGAAAFAGGLFVACVVTVLRFFADDVGLLAWADRNGYKRGLEQGRGEFETELIAAKRRVADLEVQLKDAQRPVVVERDDAKFVRSEVMDAAWSNARNLLVVTDDKGTLPGRGRSGLSESDQAAAIGVLVRAGCIERIGKQYRLTGTQSEAYKALSDLAERGAASKQAQR